MPCRFQWHEAIPASHFGKPVTDLEAVEWYRNRARDGDRFARRGLALSYEPGYRVVQNHSVALAIDTVLTRDPAVPDDDLVHELIPKHPGCRRQDFDSFLKQILQPGRFLIAIDEFIEHPPRREIELSD